MTTSAQEDARLDEIRQTVADNPNDDVSFLLEVIGNLDWLLLLERGQ